MNSNRSLRSNTNLTGRTSPNIPTTRTDSSLNRSASPMNTQYSRIREEDRDINLSPAKNFNESDRKFHRIAFERCADLPDREIITNREKFVQALNYVGYDLLESKIDELWSRFKPRVTLSKFERVLFDEEPINQRNLEEAFEILYNKDRKPHWNAVDYNQFQMDMLEHGDRLTKDEFEKLRYLLGTDQGKVDVKKLTKMIEETKINCREKILIEKKEQRKDEFEHPSSRMNSQKSNNNVHIIIDPVLKKLDIPPTTRSSHMNGVFFCEYNDSPMNALYYSIGYSFELKRNTPIWITIKPHISHYHQDQTFNNLDIRLFLFEVVPQKTSRRLLHISTERSGNKSYLHLNDLPKGSYEILPITFGGVLRTRSREINDRLPTKKLRETKRGGQLSMTNDYRAALEYIFDVFDFDENKQLDRREYNLWTLRTVGEEITDDDWLSIRDHVRLDKDENISKEKFLILNDFEVQNKETTEQALWVGLNRLGFNYALELDMMCPFSLTVHINDPGLHLEPTSYVELNEIKKPLIKFIKTKGEKIRVNNRSIDCFNYHDGSGSILYAENRSASDVKLSVQITRSVNTALNLPINARKPPVIDIRRDTTQIIWFAHKLDSQRAMELDANIETQ